MLTDAFGFGRWDDVWAGEAKCAQEQNREHHKTECIDVSQRKELTSQMMNSDQEQDQENTERTTAPARKKDCAGYAHTGPRMFQVELFAGPPQFIEGWKLPAEIACQHVRCARDRSRPIQRGHSRNDKCGIHRQQPVRHCISSRNVNAF